MKDLILTIATYVLIIALIGCKNMKVDTNPFDDGKVGIEFDVGEMLEEEKNN